MEQNLTVNTKNQSGEQVNLGDEKTKIIEDKSPDKVRNDKAPLPQIDSAK